MNSINDDRAGAASGVVIITLLSAMTKKTLACKFCISLPFNPNAPSLSTSIATNEHETTLSQANMFNIYTHFYDWLERVDYYYYYSEISNIFFSMIQSTN